MAAQCMCCEAPLVSETDHLLHLCQKCQAEDKENYGDLPPVQPGGEVIWLVQVEEFNMADGTTFVRYYETGAVMEELNLDVVRVEMYPGVKARVVLSDGETPTIYCFPWHKVLHWQEG